MNTNNGYDFASGRQDKSYISGKAVLYYGYNKGQLSTVSRKTAFTDTNTNVTRHWMRYAWAFDNWGNPTSIKVQGSSSIEDDVADVTGWSTGTTLASYAYNGNNGNLKKLTYGNGAYEEYKYDRYDRVVETKHYASASASTPTYTERFTYDGNGNVSLCEVLNGSTVKAAYRYTYDSLGRLIYSSEVRGSVTALRTQHSYDTDNRIIAQSYQLGGATFTEGYTYRNTDGAMTEYTLSSSAEDGKKDTLSFGYDNLKRLGTVTAKTVTTGTSGTNEATHYTKTYTYRDISSTRTTTQIAKLQYTDLPYKPSYAYTYDAGGQISRVTDETGEYMDYCYDLQGQLTNATLRNWTGERIEWYDYNYDTVGNILSWTVKGHRTASHTYTYGNADWPDLLTAFDGQAIVYEGQLYNYSTGSVSGTPTSGNPIRYPAPNGYFYLEWADGRKLEAIENTSNQLSFTYGQDGLRTSKTVEYTATHNYYYAGGKLLRETYDNNTLDFAYDAEGKPYSLTYNGTKYYYITNLQGDVMYLVNSSGAEVATYVYSPYGEVLTATGSMANINPLRYRGYYYDTETGLYYLQSRYYNPVAGRFINADDTANLGIDGSILGYNLFAYCLNNPVNMTDSTGNWPSWATKLVAAVAVVAVVATVAAITVATAGAGSAVACMALGAAKGAAVGFVSGAVSGAATSAVTHVVTTGSFDGIGDAMLNGMADGALSGAISGAVTGAMTSNACFIAGTAVLAASGVVAIENIKAGDYVWAWDEETGDVALKQVVETYINETDELVHVHVNGEEIICTPSHPFYSPVKGWTDAVHLRAGDILVLVNGEYVVVEKIQHEILENPIEVYNFQVQDYHTYYVSSAGVLVHNTCMNDRPAKNTQNYSATMESEGHARALARTKIGSNPVDAGFGKLRSADGVWQYRAKPSDIVEKHIHLERLDITTGEVLINWHLRWN